MSLPPSTILLAIGGHVLDVTASAFLYGPGKPRWCYAGRAVGRASALGTTCSTATATAAAAAAPAAAATTSSSASGSAAVANSGVGAGAGAGVSVGAAAQGEGPAEVIGRWGDDLSGLGDRERAILRKRVAFFLKKFPKVGTLQGAELVMPG